MRLVVLLLIVANVALFAFARLDRAAQSEGGRLRMQVEPQRIRPMTPQEVAALSPGKAVGLAGACVEWGPFVDADRVRAEGDLTARGMVGTKVEPRPQSNGQVVIVVHDVREAAMARLRELQAQYPGTDLRTTACPAAP